MRKVKGIHIAENIGMKGGSGSQWSALEPRGVLHKFWEMPIVLLHVLVIPSITVILQLSGNGTRRLSGAFPRGHSGQGTGHYLSPGGGGHALKFWLKTVTFS